tara:strand:+ start:239 stop:472 length:234 start_codon:yes stop_codon:yes gene_type:complete
MKKSRLPRKTWWEMFLEDTNIIEKSVIVLWFALPSMLYIMTEGLNFWYRVLISGGISVILTIIVWIWAGYMAEKEWY